MSRKRMVRPNVNRLTSNDTLHNIGALLDIPTGFPVKGLRGETIINGGLGQNTGVVGIGNNFKSTIMNDMMCSVCSRVMSTHDTLMHTYDTEINTVLTRLENIGSKYKYLNQNELMRGEMPTWIVSNKSNYYADEWYNKIKEFLTEKIKKGDKDKVDTPFIDFRTDGVYKEHVSTFSTVDSLTEFETKLIAEFMTKENLGDSSSNTLYMKQGLMKTKFLAEVPRLGDRSNNRMLMTAHLGKDMNLQIGPIKSGPPKKLQHLKNGDKIVGVTNKFNFLMYNVWNAANAAPYLNKTTLATEYPIDSYEKDDKEVLDLYKVKLTNIRSKSGRTGYSLPLLISQKHGLQSTLTEFDFLRRNKMFGISGTTQHFHMDLYPDVSFTRTTILSKINSDPLLRRAINITSELLQMNQHWSVYRADGYYQQPKEIRENITKKGYVFEDLLDTRGWWSYDQYKHDINFLSTFDILRINKDEYEPYWK